MKHTKEVQSKRTITTHVTCDSCGHNVQEGLNHHDISEVTISYAHGYDCGPDGGSRTEESVDLCPKCFVEKLKPWLVEQGIKINITESDW